MTVGLPAKMENRILSLLPRDERERLQPRLEPVSLEVKQVLFEPGQRIEHVYFPISGVISVLAAIDNGHVEVATVGSEGLVGFRALLDADTAHAAVLVQVPGQALRMRTDDLKKEFKRGSGLKPLVNRYVNAFITQLAQSAACNAFHSIEKRFCRWLLMTHDRVRSDQFPLTHELLAQMLGVRRASVTQVASKVQRAGLIRYTHGKIAVVDRPGLEAASCACYRAVRDDYEALLGEPR